MDLKTTPLKEQLVVNERAFDEVDGLYIGVLGQEHVVFDYTRYLEENQIEPIDHKVFMRANMHFINSIIQDTERKTTELFYQNKDGHILVSGELIFLFLAYVNSDMCQYLNNQLLELMTNGIAFTYNLIASLAADHLPTEILKEILDERNKGNE